LSSIAFTQQEVTVRFRPIYNGQEILLNKEYPETNGSSIQFTTLRFYVSELYFTDVLGQELMGEQYHLVDLEDSSSLTILKHTDGILNLRFLLGTDSLTNVSGNLEGVLDPINGMYWAWNSGYINFKLEGKSSLAGSKDKSFEYHIGGYLPPFPTVNELIFTTESNSKEVIIEINIDQWLSKIDLSTDHSLMIPGEKASKLAKELVPIFNIRTDAK
jgi:hypothetical protein